MPYWGAESRINRLHRCRLLLHGEGLLMDSENEKVYGRTLNLEIRKEAAGESMTLVEEESDG